jgi:hypothetical protein
MTRNVVDFVAVRFFACLLGPLCALGAVGTTKLKPETAAQFDQYVAKREAAIRARAWSAAKPAEVVVKAGAEGATVDVDDGLVHDWSGAIFIPGANLNQTLALLRNYDNHKNVFQPEVIDSKLKESQGNRLRTFLQLRKKKILTVVLNSDFDVVIEQPAPNRATLFSRSTRIAEVADYGSPGQKELPPGEDHGFLWRLNSYWRLEERDGGVYVECDTVSLSRGVPLVLSPIVKPIVKDLPEESLKQTLLALKRALAGR